MYLFLGLGSVILGLGFGVVEATKFRDLLLALPWSPIAVFIRRVLSRIIHAIVAWTASASVIALFVVVRIARNLDRQDNPHLLTPDPWPSGSGPLIIYDQS